MNRKFRINGEAVAASQEGALVIELFLNDNYRFRRNVLNGKVEFMTLPEGEGASWRPLTQEALNSIILRAERENIMEKGSPNAKIKMYVQSEEVPVFNPVAAFIDTLPRWDGKNHVASVFSRIPGLSTEQHSFLAIWIRSVVAHWLQMDMLHGNECVPTLIGEQGCGKTTFVRRLLPPQLREYYLDHLNLSNKFDKEMALTNNLLVNLDELDAIRPSQHAALKQTLSKSKVNGRPIFGRAQEDRLRFASFVATRLCLMYPSHYDSKLRMLKEYVHGWNPKTKRAIRSGPWEEPRERMSVLKKRVGEHNYREFCIEQGENGYHFMVYDSCHHNRQEVVFDADDYMNEGVPGMYAFVSPDKKYVYVVGDVLANSTGWIATFIIYQVNTETLKAKLVNAVAGIRLEKKGFTVASETRCVTPDAQCSAGMDFAFEDITYGFNGKIKRRSKEYASKEIRKRYGESLNNLRGLGIIRGQDDE